MDKTSISKHRVESGMIPQDGKLKRQATDPYIGPPPTTQKNDQANEKRVEILISNQTEPGPRECRAGMYDVYDERIEKQGGIPGGRKRQSEGHAVYGDSSSGRAARLSGEIEVERHRGGGCTKAGSGPVSVAESAQRPARTEKQKKKTDKREERMMRGALCKKVLSGQRDARVCRPACK